MYSLQSQLAGTLSWPSFCFHATGVFWQPWVKKCLSGISGDTIDVPNILRWVYLSYSCSRLVHFFFVFVLPSFSDSSVPEPSSVILSLTFGSKLAWLPVPNRSVSQLGCRPDVWWSPIPTMVASSSIFLMPGGSQKRPRAVDVAPPLSPPPRILPASAFLFFNVMELMFSLVDS